MKRMNLFVVAIFIALTAFTKTYQIDEKHHHVSESQSILVDVSHGQKFWNDPETMISGDFNRVNYLNDELAKSVESLHAKIEFIHNEIDTDKLRVCDALFIHVPTSQYTQSEIKAINYYLEKGGSLFLVMEVDYWSTLEQSNVNDLIEPFGLKFGDQIDDPTSGGHTKAGNITRKALKIPFHGGRIIEGGIPFCYSDHNNENVFGVSKELKSGGKIIAMGEAMVSLFMTSWNGVDGYECSDFMHYAFHYLLN